MAAVVLFWDTGVATVTSCENTLKRMCFNLFSRACVHRWQLFPPNRQVPLCGSANLLVRLYMRLKRQVKSDNLAGIIESWPATDFLTSPNNQDASLELFLPTFTPAQEVKTCFLTRPDNLLQTTASALAFVPTSKVCHNQSSLVLGDKQKFVFLYNSVNNPQYDSLLRQTSLTCDCACFVQKTADLCSCRPTAYSRENT